MDRPPRPYAGRCPLVLALDGSTGVCSAALLVLRGDIGAPDEGWRVIARRTDADGRGQARVLLRMVDDMLADVGAEPRDLGAVVVGTGPGTFTGVRITVATARAMALALAVPVLGVSTLGALAVAARSAEAGLLVPIVDAHRGQVFYGLYRPAGPPAAGTGRPWVRTEPFGVCDRGALVTMVAAQAAKSEEPGAALALIVGDLVGSPEESPRGITTVQAEVRAEHLVVGQRVLDEPGDAPEGRRLSAWLQRTLRSEAGTSGGTPGWTGAAVGEPGSPETVRPIYVRSPDADIHITKMRDPWAGPALEG